MYSDPLSTTTPSAVGSDNPGCVKWKETPFLHRKNLQEETSLWDNLLRRYLCPVSRLCRPANFGLGIMSPSRGVESPVPTGVHTLARTAADECCENPRKKKLIAFGVDEPISSEPVRGLKEGVFQV